MPDDPFAKYVVAPHQDTSQAKPDPFAQYAVQAPVAAPQTPSGPPGAMSPDTADLLLRTAMPGAVPGTGVMSPADLPRVLGFLGGHTPLLGGVPGAVAGGSAGEAIKQGFGALLGQPMDVKKIGKEGAISGVQQLAGVGLAKGAGILSPFNKIVMAKLSAEAENAAHQAAAQGVRVPTDRILKTAERLAVRKGVGGRQYYREAQNVVEELRNSHGNTLSPITLHEIKQFSDDVAKGVIEARRSGGFIGPAEKIKAQVWEQIGNAARQELRTKVPGYAAPMRQLSRMVRVKEAMTGGGPARTAARLGTEVAAGGAIGALTPESHLPWYARVGLGSLGAVALTNPMLLGALSNALLSPVGQEVLTQGPRVISNAARR